MRTLPPQHLKDHYWENIESQLKTMFYGIVFDPVMDILRATSPNLRGLLVENATTSALVAAIKSGKVQYNNGVFSGEFSVTISKDLKSLGAEWDAKAKVWKLGTIEVPASVKEQAALYTAKAKATHAEVVRRLDEIEANLNAIVSRVRVDPDDTIRMIEKGWQKSANVLEVKTTITPERQKELAANYTNNLGLYIEDFSRSSIKALREEVEKNALQGYRSDKLAESIRHRYGVTANKARFLARQETSLFMAQYRQQRFAEAGVRRYKWSTSNDEKVRSSHAALNGKIFNYNQPPITNRNTGERNNPGEDFGCRCVDIPVLDRDVAAA